MKTEPKTAETSAQSLAAGMKFYLYGTRYGLYAIDEIKPCENGKLKIHFSYKCKDGFWHTNSVFAKPDTLYLIPA